jgi:hypothetical protein
VDSRGQQAAQAECFAFGLGEGGAFVQQRGLEHGDASGSFEERGGAGAVLSDMIGGFQFCLETGQ